MLWLTARRPEKGNQPTVVHFDLANYKVPLQQHTHYVLGLDDLRPTGPSGRPRRRGGRGSGPATPARLSGGGKARFARPSHKKTVLAPRFDAAQDAVRPQVS